MSDMNQKRDGMKITYGILIAAVVVNLIAMILGRQGIRFIAITVMLVTGIVIIIQNIIAKSKSKKSDEEEKKTW